MENEPPGSYRIEWLNPVTGTFSKPQTVKHADGEFDLDTPTFDDDLALKVTAVSLQH